MCLLAFAWRSHPRYPLVLIGNRDEFHDREAAPAGWWPQPHLILAGRDLKAGGTWLGVNRLGRFGVVTNYREPLRETTGRSSRGELVVDFLTTGKSTEAWMNEVASRRDEYGGFNLIIGDGDRIHYLTNRGERVCDLQPGIYGLSNHRLDTPWPKVACARDGLRRWIERSRPTSEALFQLLADRTPAADDELPATGVPLEWERLLSSAFILNPRYGTRVSTVLLAGSDGRHQFEERRFSPEGRCEGAGRFSFSSSPPTARS